MCILKKTALLAWKLMCVLSLLTRAMLKMPIKWHHHTLYLCTPILSHQVYNITYHTYILVTHTDTLYLCTIKTRRGKKRKQPINHLPLHFYIKPYMNRVDTIGEHRTLRDKLNNRTHRNIAESPGRGMNWGNGGLIFHGGDWSRWIQLSSLIRVFDGHGGINYAGNGMYGQTDCGPIGDT